MSANERAFEELIAKHLVDVGGWTKVEFGNQSQPREFDHTIGIHTGDLFAWIATTQQDAWNKLLKVYGGKTQVAQQRFKQRLVEAIDEQGVLAVLRRGVFENGITIKLAQFKPANERSQQLNANYNANILTVMRQFPYKGTSETIDLAFFLNGIPLATAELKNELTHQNVDHAIEQYEQRDANNLTLRDRCLVHFAVDSDNVWMTTKLDGKKTDFRYFNQGNGEHKGNPPSATGTHRTAYLWERVLERESWLDIVQRFIFEERPRKGSRKRGNIVFPRFHQWDAVRKLEADAKVNGPGQRYLVQHSAGSGKSKTLAWLSHRLSSLHNNDKKVFDKVVVITDRNVLDQQLQTAVRQFEQTSGTVHAIDENSQQLLESLTGEQARIIVTTLQKFPVVASRISSIPDRTYAVIIDEAHSSQTGESAASLKRVLGMNDGRSDEEVFEAQDNAGTENDNDDPAQDALNELVKSRGRQPNISFFAFTATPKGKTLELFGRHDENLGKYAAFHLYSMRQAIEEGYIRDVLTNYTTYDTYWKVKQLGLDDPIVESGRGSAAVASFVQLHPSMVEQKARIIVDHFNEHVADLLEGQAKAMVVTRSRLQAVRYKLAIDKYVSENNFDIATYVAFSGSRPDGGIDYTESSMNGFSDKQTTTKFDEEGDILVVAEKYQTGFDQPKLMAMYVDKTLTGLAAVQTLSRLNRTYPGKEDPFVLDFVNKAEDIQNAFEPWYTTTIAPPTDPNEIYRSRIKLDDYDVLWEDEIARATPLLVKPQSGRLQAALQPAVDRYRSLDKDEQESFADDLKRFVSVYSYLSQIVEFGNVDLERDYLFCRWLSAIVTTEGRPARVSLEGKVELVAKRLTERRATKIVLGDENNELPTTFASGKKRDEEKESLSSIVERLNEKWGAELTEADVIYAKGELEALARSKKMQDTAVANNESTYVSTMVREAPGAFLDSQERNEESIARLLDHMEAFTELVESMGSQLKSISQSDAYKRLDIADLLNSDEDRWLEFKSTLRWDVKNGCELKVLEMATLKTIAAFLNSIDGGTLLIGVEDDGNVFGLDRDYELLGKEGKRDRDVFRLHLVNICKRSFGDAATSCITTDFATVEGKDVCRVNVKMSGHPIWANVATVDKQGQHVKQRKFYARLDGSTTDFRSDEDEINRYIAQTWPPR